jgi:hypothetical protein
MTLVIPVSPATQAVGVSVRPSWELNSGLAPIVNRMVLLDRDGATVAEVDNLEGPRAGTPASAVTVALQDAPLGGSLLVQVSVPSVSQAGTTTVLDPAHGSPDLPVIVDVQRQDAAIVSAPVLPSTGSGGAMAGLPRGGTTVPAPSASSWPAASPWSEGAANPQSLPVADQAQGQTALEEETGSDIESGEVWATRVATGPLASRQAAPLGPTVATVLADTAPPVDRHDRALSEAIDGLAPEKVESEATHPSELARIEGYSPALEAAQSEDWGRRSDAVTLVVHAGLAAFPLEDTSLGGEVGRVELAALLETLPPSVGTEEVPPIVTQAEPSLGALAVALTIPSRDRVNETPYADNFTIACGLVLFLGFSYRPLLPDLLAMVQTHSSRWRKTHRAALPVRDLTAPI